MDDLDRSLLALLGADARLPLAALAKKLKVARSTVQARLERLIAQGTIAGYTVKLGEAARAGRLRATVLLTIEPRAQAAILGRLRAMAEVERAITTSGRSDLLLELAAPSPQGLDLALDKIEALSGVLTSESLIHLTTKIDRAI